MGRCPAVRRGRCPTRGEVVRELQRNSIVSGFLRMIEYYDGILFLTTNRILIIDSTFQSRIQLAIKFPDASPAMRRRVWENFINMLDPAEVEAKRELLEHLDDMQEWNLNGRQIRSVMTIAQGLSLSLERRRGALRYSRVVDVVNLTIQFQDLFPNSSREQKARLGGLNSRQFQEKKVVRKFP